MSVENIGIVRLETQMQNVQKEISDLTFCVQKLTDSVMELVSERGKIVALEVQLVQLQKEKDELWEAVTDIRKGQSSAIEGWLKLLITSLLGGVVGYFFSKIKGG